jgi:hypothetical protein
VKRRKIFSPKRRLRPAPDTGEERQALEELASRATYGEGNPEHKRNPGDFRLPAIKGGRQHKSLCDTAAVVDRATAQRLLREGIRRGMVSEQERNSWPQNVWAVAANGVPLEAQLENQERGSYHGYPMAENDPLRELVLDRWNR